MGERAKSLALRSVPWREGIGWPVVAVEGIALLAIGLFMVFRPGDAADLTRTLLGLALLVVSLQQIVTAFRHPAHSFMPFQMLRGGIGVTIGLLVSLQPLVRTFSDEAARVVLGVGLLVVGAIGLVGLLTARNTDRVRLESVVTAALTIGFGFVLLAGDGNGAPVLGWVIAVAGLGLLAYAVVLVMGRRGSRATRNV